MIADECLDAAVVARWLVVRRGGGVFAAYAVAVLIIAAALDKALVAVLGAF